MKEEKLISILIPTLSQGSQKGHFVKLEKLLTEYLPNQVYDNYEALVFCDGKNLRVKRMIEDIKDPKIRYFSTSKTLAKWGHPQTRLGINVAQGKYFVRLNDDNIPYQNYLSILAKGFKQNIDVVYARVVFMGEARLNHSYTFRKSKNYVLPQDKKGKINEMNIDCMNYMVKTKIAKKYIKFWNDDFAADWNFINKIKKEGCKFKFIDKIIGEKH